MTRKHKRWLQFAALVLINSTLGGYTSGVAFDVSMIWSAVSGFLLGEAQCRGWL